MVGWIERGEMVGLIDGYKAYYPHRKLGPQ